MQTRRATYLCAATILVTPSKRNFLRVNAQMHNLDKQKTYACLENVVPHAQTRPE
jgi:hypothetical protein